MPSARDRDPAAQRTSGNTTIDGRAETLRDVVADISVLGEAFVGGLSYHAPMAMISAAAVRQPWRR